MKTKKSLALVLLLCGGLARAAFGTTGLFPHDYSDDLLDTFSFGDNTNWTDDYGYFPLMWTNLSSVTGDGPAVLLDNTNGSWLQYPLVLQDGSWTNLILGQGTVMFWVFPTNSASSTGWSLDSGQWGTFLEAGSFTPDASYGWWSLYTDGTNILFSAQGNDGSQTNYICAPLNYILGSNAWTHVALTYSSNATQVFVNGSLLATGPGISVLPDLGVITNGFYLGSSGASNQLHAAFDDVWIYDCPVDGDTIAGTYGMYSIVYSGWLAPVAMSAMISSAPSTPSTNSVTPDVITGPGCLQWNGAASTCINGVDAYHVWITNVTATAAGGGTMNVRFTVQGGQDGYAYDVFATSALQSPITNATWAWMGQTYHCNTYTMTNISGNVFIILGTSLDDDGDGLTTAYELLVSHTDPHNPYSNLDGLLDGWDILLGLNPQMSNLTEPGTRSTYGYTTADWLNQVSGVRSGSVNLDNEGNVLSVSQ